ncbi:MAG: glycosyltransferase family A protein [Weeksellaceae bacterium]|jgi:glycosyltransferase involved in cell wall biosynthesis|nr:glycosyltransferase family A protein [Weeksellaceae bacterium]
MDCKITIITPTYNRVHTLERVYESIVNQSFKQLKWLIMDDGSTDGTEKLVRKFQDEKLIEIDYFWQENQHKFHTVFDGVKKVITPYFVIWDSDDKYPKNSLEILYNEVSKLPKDGSFITALGLSAYENGEIVGDRFPENLKEGSVLEMRYKHQIKGDKNGIFITKIYKEVLAKLNLLTYKKGVYIPYSVFYNLYDSLGYKTRFINQVIRFYMFDEADAASVSNTRSSGKNQYGLMIGHLSFVNDYGRQLDIYPKAKIRNIIGYQVYAFAEKTPIFEINKKLKHFRFLAFLLLPFSYLFYLLKIKNNGL